MTKVELVYVPLNQEAVHITLDLKPKASVLDALIASGIYSTHPETRTMSVGVYAKQASLDQILKEGDRVEIYRPLILDPKEKRRQKAITARKKST